MWHEVLNVPPGSQVSSPLLVNTAGNCIFSLSMMGEPGSVTLHVQRDSILVQFEYSGGIFIRI